MRLLAWCAVALLVLAPVVSRANTLVYNHGALAISTVATSPGWRIGEGTQAIFFVGFTDASAGQLITVNIQGSLDGGTNWFTMGAIGWTITSATTYVIQAKNWMNAGIGTNANDFPGIPAPWVRIRVTNAAVGALSALSMAVVYN